MKEKMFTIFDAKAHAYTIPWFMITEDMAKRTFGDSVNDRSHNFGMHPEDYTLFCIGHFDNATAVVESHAPLALGNGVEFVVDRENGDAISNDA